MVKRILRAVQGAGLAALILVSGAAIGPPARSEQVPYVDVYIRAEQLLKAGKYAGAEKLFRKSMSMAEKSVGRETLDFVRIANSLATALFYQGRYEDAEDELRRAVSIAERALGSEKLLVAKTLDNLAHVLSKQRRYSEAEPLYKRSLAIRERELGSEHSDVGTSAGNLAALIYRQGHLAEAEPHFKRSLEIFEKALGANHVEVATALDNLATLYESQHRYAEAEPLLKRSLAIREKALGKDHLDVAASLNELALLYQRQGRYAQSERLYKRALAIVEKELEANHSSVAELLGNLAGLYKELGRYSEAEQLYRRFLEIRKDNIGTNHPDIAKLGNNLAWIYEAQGRFAEAEPLYRHSLAILEETLGPDDPAVSTSLTNLATLYVSQGRIAAAELLLNRSLAIREKKLGPDHPDVANTLDALAMLYEDQGRTAEAEPLYRRALAIAEKTLGRDHRHTGTVLNNLAGLYESQGRAAEAEPLYKRSLYITEKTRGRNHPSIGRSLNNIALFYQRQGRYAEAEPLYKRSLAILEKALGPYHPDVATGLNNFGTFAKQLGQFSSAYERIHRAVAIYSVRALSGAAQRRTLDGRAAGEAVHFHEQADLVHEQADLAWRLAREKPARRAELIEAAFNAAQWAGRTSAAAALGQMAARFGGGDSKLARLVRTRQDLSRYWQALDKKLIEAIGAPAGERDQKAIDDLRAALAAADKRIAELSATLERDFPKYAELANPRPLEFAQVQKILATDEVLALYLVSADESFVWAVTREAVRWQRIGVGDASMSDRVNALRRGLDPSVKGGARGKQQRALVRRDRGEGLPFDLEAAHALYEDLLGPLEELIKDKKRLIIVPSGPLTSLPFHVLVTEKPNQALARYEGYARAAWLLKRHAITMLPSVSSLRALRVFAAKARASEPFVGFGDPVFRRAAPRRNERKRKRRNRGVRAASAGGSLGISGYFRGVRADADKLGQLARLADTEEELKQIARSLGAPESEIRLRRQASETVVKATTLDRYRVVAFATHGLVAGELKGLAEPGLALTVPTNPTETDDGLLTASEVAQLKLNADWVLLSACNTAAGEGQGAEALSGLARAFFYAGARALLVSHWPVRSDAAVKLTTGAMAELQREPGIGRAEALRRSMLALMRDGSDPTSAHPAVWAPFVVVGEGGARGNAGISAPPPAQEKKVAAIATTTPLDLPQKIVAPPALEPAKPRARGPWRVALYKGVDFFGADLRNPPGVKVKSLQACVRACRKNAKCRAFTFSTKKRYCYLKSAAGALDVFGGAVSGLLFQGRRGDAPTLTVPLMPWNKRQHRVAFEAHDLLAQPIITKNENHCRAECLRWDACVGYTFDQRRSGGRKRSACLLKSALAPRTGQPGRSSNRKQGTRTFTPYKVSDLN